MKIIIESKSEKMIQLFKELENRCKMYKFSIELIDEENKNVLPNLAKRLLNIFKFR